jgi:hypothetical protein
LVYDDGLVLWIQAAGLVNIFLTPALINSDVVENEFNQQRSTYNGANTNPNALQVWCCGFKLLDC